MAPIVLYSLVPSPPCRSILLTAKYIGLELTVKNVDLRNLEHLTPSFLKMNPTHTIPTIDDNGFYLWESRAIMTYLVETYAKDDYLYPKDIKMRAIVDQMLYFDADSLYSSILSYLHMVIRQKKMPDQATVDKIYEKMDFLDIILKDSPYAAGKKLSLADISLLVTVTTLEAIDIDYSDKYANISKWVEKLKKEVPGYDEINQTGTNALAEFCRDIIAEMK